MADKYSMADVGAIIALSTGSLTIEQVRTIIITASNVPIERVNACADETIQAVDMLRGAVQLFVAVNGHKPSVTEMAEVCAECAWIDDDKKTIASEVTIVTEEGDEIFHARGNGRLA